MKRFYSIPKIALLLVICSLVLISCSKAEASKKEDENKKKYFAEKNEVDAIVLKKSDFDKEIVSNGKLTALQKNSLRFEVDGRLQKLFVTDGAYVKKNQTLAEIMPFKYQQAFTSAEINLKKASLELADMLVGRGFDIKQKENIPEAIYNMAALRSGYTEALHQMKNARFELAATKLMAPFNGKVASISSKEQEHISPGSELMILVDDTEFEVEFYLIESEIKEISLKDKVEIIPFAVANTYKGTVTTINPIVEKNGTVLVKAIVKNDGKLLEGMNVKVRILKQVKEQLVVPKAAVLLRDNQEVLFKVVSGKAFWTYVKTTDENSNSYSLIAHPDKSSASLKAGDTVIVSGNLNLAHDSDVLIRSIKEN
jgi:membrane fusion protein (multidrug efflux system)